MKSNISKKAIIGKNVLVGNNSKIWHFTQIRENVSIGRNCIIGTGVYLDSGIKIGNNVKIQNYSCIYRFTEIENNVFIGPRVLILNDKIPRSVNSKGLLKSEKDWLVGHTLIKEGASIGGGAIILPDLVIGKYCLIGAGAVVTKNVDDYSIMIGNPAKVLKYICKCGKKISFKKKLVFQCSCFKKS